MVLLLEQRGVGWLLQRSNGRVRLRVDTPSDPLGLQACECGGGTGVSVCVFGVYVGPGGGKGRRAQEGTRHKAEQKRGGRVCSSLPAAQPACVGSEGMIH